MDSAKRMGYLSSDPDFSGDFMLHSGFGLLCLILVAWCASDNRRLIPWRIIASGLGLQFAVAALTIKAPLARDAFLALNGVVTAMEEATRAGTGFVFGYVGGGELPFAESRPGAAFSLAFQALPMVIVVAALASLLYYWRILPRVVKGCSFVLEKTMGIGGVLGVGAAGSIFLGMVESPLLIRPYLASMTASELFSLMSVGMSCIAGTMLMLYAAVLKPVIPDALGHILTASVIHAPAALLVAAVMMPETRPPTLGRDIPSSQAQGAVDALTRGTVEGLGLFWNIVAMLLVFVAVVKLANIILGGLPAVGGEPVSLQRLLGLAMAPAAWLIGIPWSEARTAGSLIGIKIVLNEFLAFIDLAALPQELLSERTRLILTYAMCSFANFGSLGILVAGLGSLCPERHSEISSLGLRSLMAGIIASLMTGAVVGVVSGF